MLLKQSKQRRMSFLVSIGHSFFITKYRFFLHSVMRRLYALLKSRAKWMRKTRKKKNSKLRINKKKSWIETNHMADEQDISRVEKEKEKKEIFWLLIKHTNTSIYFGFYVYIDTPCDPDVLSFFFVFGCCICVSRVSGGEGGQGKRKEIDTDTDTIDKQRQKKTKPRRIAVHRRKEKTKNRCFISRKTSVIGSPDVSFIRITLSLSLGAGEKENCSRFKCVRQYRSMFCRTIARKFDIRANGEDVSPPREANVTSRQYVRLHCFHIQYAWHIDAWILQMFESDKPALNYWN